MPFILFWRLKTKPYVPGWLWQGFEIILVYGTQVVFHVVGYILDVFQRLVLSVKYDFIISEDNSNYVNYIIRYQHPKVTLIRDNIVVHFVALPVC